MEDHVVLLDFNVSVFTMRVRIALALKGIKYETKVENLPDKSPLLLEMNPVHKLVPVLIHNGKPICESSIIVEYIDETWPQKYPLLPSNPYERSQARFLVDYMDKKLQEQTRTIYRKKGEEQEKAKTKFIEILKTLEGDLGEKPFFGGETVGFVDIAFAAYSNAFYALETFANFSVEAECPKIVALAKRCLEIESVAKSLPHPKELYDFLVLINKKLGS